MSNLERIELNPSSVFDRLMSLHQTRRSGFTVLIDPDNLDYTAIERFCETMMDAGVDALLLGGSLLRTPELDKYVRKLSACVDLPIIGFPGSVSQISPHLDAILYLSLISGRNADLLFGQHVHGAPIIKQMQVEPISTGYMLIESGKLTTAQYISNSLPLPRSKPEISAATALAAEMMGMKMLYTDAGSGADRAVPLEIISAVTHSVDIPLIVGGGLTSPSLVDAACHAGAKFIVVGTAIEQNSDKAFVKDLVSSAHG